MGGVGRFLGIGVVVIILLGIGLSFVTYEQIDEGERGIVIVQGAVTEVREPGIFFSFMPFTRVEKVNVKRQTRQISQNVASSDKQLYDIDIAVDYSRNTSPEALRAQYGQIGVSDEQLNAFLDGFINDAVKSASTQFTLDQVLVDRGGLSNRIAQLLTTTTNDGKSPIEQLYVRLDAVKVTDVKVGDAYAELLKEKANLEVKIETEEKRRQQIEAEQANNLFQAEQEAKTALTREKGQTAAALEAASRESQVRASQGRYYRENPELLELRQRELMVEMMQNGNIWFVDPNTNLTLLLNQMGQQVPQAVVQQQAQQAPTQEQTEQPAPQP
jgi:regulator of protease activity HflC (stomatin/prohibitin superfamily)